MNKHIDWIKRTRQSLLQLVEGLTTEQLNEVPSGFNNNIIWNLAHLVAVQQGICYKRSGVSTVVDEQFIAAFTRGTKPERLIDAAEVDNIKDELLTSLDQFQQDHIANLFANYRAWTTPYTVELASIEDAIDFLVFHEGLHYGYVMALRRLVNSKALA